MMRICWKTARGRNYKHSHATHYSRWWGCRADETHLPDAWWSRWAAAVRQRRAGGVRRREWRTRQEVDEGNGGLGTRMASWGMGRTCRRAGTWWEGDGQVGVQVHGTGWHFTKRSPIPTNMPMGKCAEAQRHSRHPWATFKSTSRVPQRYFIISITTFSCSFP